MAQQMDVTHESGLLEPKKHWAVKQYASYVRSIARRIKSSLPAQIELEDLVNDGMIGLLEAAERYKPELGANFTTFSYYRIQGAIYDGLRRMGHVSRGEYQKIRFQAKANAYLEQKSNARLQTEARSVSSQEALDEMAIQVSHLVTIYITSLDALENQEPEDHASLRQDVCLQQKQMKHQLHQAMAALSETDRELIVLYYFQDLSLEEVGKRLGLSRSWTCRRHAQAIERLGQHMTV